MDQTLSIEIPHAHFNTSTNIVEDSSANSSTSLIAANESAGSIIINTSPVKLSPAGETNWLRCPCGKVDEDNSGSESILIQCDECKIWYHDKCQGIEEFEAADIDKFYCSKCKAIRGDSVLKIYRNKHRHDYSEEDNDNKKNMQNGTPAFIEMLLKRSFTPGSIITDIMEDSNKLTLPYLEGTRFQRPILMTDSTGCNLKVPSDFTYDDLENLIGKDFIIDIIDVRRQETFQTSLGKYIDLMRLPTAERKKPYNCISLEFSKTELNDSVSPPSVVEEICWVSKYWPDRITDDRQEHEKYRPYVSKFCLVGMADSYTDFHIDFGGTSVWYHVLQGEKVFYFYEPTEKNVAGYEKWFSSDDHAEIFLADVLPAAECYKLSVKEGQTIMIPTGWIHAVFTPVDSIVFGGNFLHSFSVPLQLSIYEMELRLRVTEKFMFPNYEITCWHAANGISDHFKELIDEKQTPKAYQIEGAQALLDIFNHWMTRDDVPKQNLCNHSLTDVVTFWKIMKDLERRLKAYSKILKKDVSKLTTTKKKTTPLRDPFEKATRQGRRVIRNTTARASLLLKQQEIAVIENVVADENAEEENEPLSKLIGNIKTNVECTSGKVDVNDRNQLLVEPKSKSGRKRKSNAKPESKNMEKKSRKSVHKLLVIDQSDYKILNEKSNETLTSAVTSIAQDSAVGSAESRRVKGKRYRNKRLNSKKFHASDNSDKAQQSNEIKVKRGRGRPAARSLPVMSFGTTANDSDDSNLYEMKFEISQDTPESKDIIITNNSSSFQELTLSQPIKLEDFSTNYIVMQQLLSTTAPTSAVTSISEAFATVSNVNKNYVIANIEQSDESSTDEKVQQYEYVGSIPVASNVSSFSSDNDLSEPELQTKSIVPKVLLKFEMETPVCIGQDPSGITKSDDFLSELGAFRQDAEYIYPSLIDQSDVRKMSRSKSQKVTNHKKKDKSLISITVDDNLTIKRPRRCNQRRTAVDNVMQATQDQIREQEDKKPAKRGRKTASRTARKSRLKITSTLVGDNSVLLSIQDSSAALSSDANLQSSAVKNLDVDNVGQKKIANLNVNFNLESEAEESLAKPVTNVIDDTATVGSDIAQKLDNSAVMSTSFVSDSDSDLVAKNQPSTSEEECKAAKPTKRKPKKGQATVKQRLASKLNMNPRRMV